MEDYEPLSKQWRWREHWSGERGTYHYGPYHARVVDMDGDAATYFLKRGEDVLLDGECRDFWEAIKIVEDRLVELGALYRPAETKERAT